MNDTNTNSISISDVKKVANLSRFSSDMELEQALVSQTHLSAILDFANDLSKVDVTGYSSFGAMATVTINDLRDDQIDPDTVKYERVKKNIIANFPDKQDDFLQLPVRIIEEN
jgi:aspartyl/glutamyl-tRNA(Asn/Gln) amidotransferase C subunit